MTLKPFRFEPEAEVDLEESALFYDRHLPGLGAEFVAEVQSTIDRIRSSPETFPPVPGVAPRLRAQRGLLKRFPFSIVFVESADVIRVFAIAHAKRHPRSWQGRLQG